MCIIERPSFPVSFYNIVFDLCLTKASLAPCHFCSSVIPFAGGNQHFPGPTMVWVRYFGFRRRPKARCRSPYFSFSAPSDSILVTRHQHILGWSPPADRYNESNSDILLSLPNIWTLHIFERSISSLLPMLWFCSAFWWPNINIYLVSANKQII